MISVDQAQALIAQHTSKLSASIIPLIDALECYLSSNISAERDYPPFDRITHDGIAIHSSNLSRHFRIARYAAAGEAQAVLDDYASCIEVATGAPLPIGCDTIIPYEMIAIDGNGATLKDGYQVTLGNALHKQGVDVKKDQRVLAEGTKIGIAEIAILAANGLDNVPVYRKPSIGILATGDELVAINSPIEPYQIRRSNDIMLQSALILNGFNSIETAWTGDNKVQMAMQIDDWLANKDVILLIGGVSRGKFDFSGEVLESLGVTKIFHQVAQRPGKPLWFGIAKSGKPIFGLPGNPVSCLTCLIRYVLPMLRKMSGGMQIPMTKRLSTEIAANKELTLFVPIIGDEDNTCRQVFTQGSGDFTNLQGSIGFVELPARTDTYKISESAAFFAWNIL